MHESNLEQLAAAARMLLPVLKELVFVGGCATGLLMTDKAAAEVRRTYDVDVIAELASYTEYNDFSERLRGLGFVEDNREDAPVCRWIQGQITLDVMPLCEEILGFTNRWYREALNTSISFQVDPQLTIRLITAPHFLATKLEAFKGRGRNDFLASHDLEDIIAVIDGRPDLGQEVAGASLELRLYVAKEFYRLLGIPGFVDSLPGHLRPDPSSQARLGILLRRMEALAASTQS